MPELFGTDGIRGKALAPPLDESTVRRLGTALAQWLPPTPRILLAGDTRASTEVLARWLAESLQAAGCRVVWGGVLPTPAVSVLLRTDGFDAGVVISASHNPAEDNGIKVLGPGGEKLPETVEEELEALLATAKPVPGPALPGLDPALRERYLHHLLASLGEDGERPLEGLRLIVDTAHGAAAELAGPLFETLGASVEVVACSPDGDNINAGCGATAPEHVAGQVLATGADAGLALDGDADRAILVDETGAVLDGDDILLAWGRDLASRGLLPGRAVVATVMSNLALERGLAASGIRLHRSPVGDRNVWLAMQEHGAALGGEQSGHIICAHHAVTGDGLLTGAHLLALARRQGRPLSEISDLERLPQVLRNVPVRRKPPFAELSELTRWIGAAEERLAGSGRILLRYSGTEPKARIMVEGDDPSLIEELAAEGADLIRRLLG